MMSESNNKKCNCPKCNDKNTSPFKKFLKNKLKEQVSEVPADDLPKGMPDDYDPIIPKYPWLEPEKDPSIPDDGSPIGPEGQPLDWCPPNSACCGELPGCDCAKGCWYDSDGNVYHHLWVWFNGSYHLRIVRENCHGDVCQMEVHHCDIHGRCYWYVVVNHCDDAGVCRDYALPIFFWNGKWYRMNPVTGIWEMSTGGWNGPWVVILPPSDLLPVGWQYGHPDSQGPDDPVFQWPTWYLDLDPDEQEIGIGITVPLGYDPNFTKTQLRIWLLGTWIHFAWLYYEIHGFWPPSPCGDCWTPPHWPAGCGGPHWPCP